MSYILDALKKAEHQRDIGRVPGIGSEHESLRRPGPPRWPWVLALVLSANAALLLILFWPGSPSSTAPSREVAENSTTPPTEPVRPPSPAPAPSSSARSEAVAPVDTRLPPTTLRPLPPLHEPGAVDGVENRGGEADKAPAPPPARAAVRRDDNNLPVWPQVSAQLMSEINGSLHLDVHVYSERPAERFVLINMRKYLSGEKLQEGPVVDEITPGGVILSLHGQRFRMQAQ